MSLTIISCDHPQRKLPFPKGTRSAMVNRLFFLEEDRTTSDFLGIVTLVIGQEKQPRGHPPCAGQAVWFYLGAQGGRDGVKN